MVKAHCDLELYSLSCACRSYFSHILYHFDFAGIGISIVIAYSSSSGERTQPSNSFATVHGNSGLWLLCCSNSTDLQVGNFTFPDGDVHAAVYDPPVYISYIHDCIKLDYYNGSQHTFTLSPDAVGIYTCTIPDSEGNLLQENIGIYNVGSNSKYQYTKLACVNHNNVTPQPLLPSYSSWSSSFLMSQ